MQLHEMAGSLGIHSVARLHKALGGLDVQLRGFQGVVDCNKLRDGPMPESSPE
jgi:hypothetical protein